MNESDGKNSGSLWFIIIMCIVVASVYSTITFGELHKYPIVEQGVIELINSDCSVIQLDPCVEKEKPHGKTPDSTKNGK